MSTHPALAQYRSTHTQARAAEADPHRVIALLLEGLRERLAAAGGAIRRGDAAAKVRQIDAAVGIIEGLRMALDRDAGGEIADNLDRLYDYALRRLASANASDDAGAVDEVAGLFATIEDAWQRIGDGERT